MPHSCVVPSAAVQVKSSDGGTPAERIASAGVSASVAIARGGYCRMGSERTFAVVITQFVATLVGVDGTLVWSEPGGEVLKLQRLDDRTTLTAALALPDGALVVSSLAGLRRVERTR